MENIDRDDYSLVKAVMVIIVILIIGIAISTIGDIEDAQPQQDGLAKSTKRPTLINENTVVLRKGRYAKLGSELIVMCRLKKDVKEGRKPVNASKKRDHLWVTDACFHKSLEFQFEYVEKASSRGISRIKVGIPLQNARYLWVKQSDLEPHIAHRYDMDMWRELYDHLKWE